MPQIAQNWENLNTKLKNEVFPTNLSPDAVPPPTMYTVAAPARLPSVALSKCVAHMPCQMLPPWPVFRSSKVHVLQSHKKK